MAARKRKPNLLSATRFLPEDIAWVYLHPGLLRADYEPMGTDEVDKIELYERSNPAPNHGAVTMLSWARQNQDKFFPKVQQLMADGRKAERAEKAKGKKDVGDQGDDLHFDDLLLELGMEK